MLWITKRFDQGSNVLYIVAADTAEAAAQIAEDKFKRPFSAETMQEAGNAFAVQSVRV